ncbi:hypothetical protein ACFY1V_31775 [Streptomyces sp. NPDC001255]|uniref:hypothetical protein n=1 Tax=Streptomyces sp. NPDC001255 TaxID=3364550 RepID=UPI0036A60FEB
MANRLTPMHQTSPLSGEIGVVLQPPQAGVHEARFRHLEYGITLRVTSGPDGVRLAARATLTPADRTLLRYSAAGDRGAADLLFPEVVRVTEEWGDTDAIEDVLYLAVQVADAMRAEVRAVGDARAARGELPRPLPDGDRGHLSIAVLQTHPVGGNLSELLFDEREMRLSVYPEGQSPEEYGHERYRLWDEGLQVPELPLDTGLGVVRGVRPAAVEEGQQAADERLTAAGFTREGEWTLGLGQYTALVRRAQGAPDTPPAPATAVPVPAPAPENPSAPAEDPDAYLFRDRSIAPDGERWRRAHVVINPACITDPEGRAELSVIPAAPDSDGPDRDDDYAPSDLESVLSVPAGLDHLPAIRAAALERLREEGWYAHGDWAPESHGDERVFYVCRVPEED